MSSTGDRIEAALTHELHQVPHDDPYVNGHLVRIEARVRAVESLAAEFYGGVSGLQRKRVSARDAGNPGTAGFVAADPTASDWLATIPTAAALAPLYDPDAACLPNGSRVGDELREWFKNTADARGIRSRAHVMQKLLMQEASGSHGTQRWLSLACGAAQPVLHSMEKARESGFAVPKVTLADLDRSALGLARRYAQEAGVSENTAVVRVNVLRREGFARVSQSMVSRRVDWTEAFDVVDAVGILEYLKPDDWTYTYQGVVTSRRRMAGAITFIRNAFACVNPGGLLIVGNMLDSRPQIGFTLDVIQWPHIQPRSVDVMRDLFRQAGVRGHVDIYLPADGVYGIYAVRKAA